MDKLTFRKKLEGQLEQFYSDEIRIAPTPQFAKLLEKMKSLILSGGKRFRPYVAFLTYSSYGGKDFDKLLRVALSSELLHNYILIHDDIIDNDLERYGMLNITGQYLKNFTSLENDSDRLRLAEGMAIVAGDIGHSLTYKNLLGIDSLDDREKKQLCKLLTNCNIDLLAGQQIDTLNIKFLIDDFTLDRLITTCILKSSSYSTIIPMKMAAILLDLNDGEIKLIEKFAVQLGILYQLVDDYSDYFINKTDFNTKAKYRDFRQGKITHPYFVALELASEQERDFLKENFGNKKIPQGQLEKVTDILLNCGARDRAIELISKYAVKSQDCLNKLNISKEGKNQMLELIEHYKTI